uniref:Putative BEL1-like homeodomain protein 7 n=1 Tax=Davidia involucrata TaxID=16924 RepID=A0A5B6ZP99_DAVIN
MATYYPSLSNQRDVLPTYLQKHKLPSYPESPHLPSNMMYLNQASTTGSYGELLSGRSLSPRKCVGTPSIGGKNEVVFIPPTAEPVSMQLTGGRLNITTGIPVDNSVTRDPQMVSRTPLHILDGEQNLQYQRLSLSLATQIPSVVHVPLFQKQYTDQRPSSLLSSHVPNSGEDGSQSKELRNAEYLSFDLPGSTHTAIKMGALNNPQFSISPKDMHCGPHLFESSSLSSTIFNYKYLKAAQQLLDEVVNVQSALKQHESDKHHNFRKFGLDGSKETHLKSNGRYMLPLMNGMSSDLHESTTNLSCELSPAERLDLQNMLDEVDRRYKQYYHQMQIVVSSFEMIVGCGAAKPYTELALQSISCHFRCLRDAINSQIRVTQQSLGEDEQDAIPNGQGGGLSRLRYVDQQLRQQRALQQLGMIRHSWRPQRGLPENSVSILRAWMFEHFLHPYPKDSEKIMLARQTGLTRSQVANWFINARVRLWKPMVEEMYKEEFGNLEADSKSSPEQALEAARDKLWASEDRGEELQESVTSTIADGGHLGQFNDSKSDPTPDTKMLGCTARLGFQNGAHGDDDIDSGMVKLQRDQRPNVNDHSLRPDKIIPPNWTGDGGLMAAAATHDISESGGFAVGNQVSLALGLQHK